MFRPKRHFTITTRIHIVSPFFKFYYPSSGDKITVGSINMKKANLKNSCSCSIVESSCKCPTARNRLDDLYQVSLENSYNKNKRKNVSRSHLSAGTKFEV